MKTSPRSLQLLSSSLVGIALLASLPAAGVEFRQGQNVEISTDEVIEDDLYVAGDTITIDGIVRGDLVAAGRVITLNGAVEGDLIAGGQAIVIEGSVGDDARIAGMALKIGSGGMVADDLFAAGFSLETQSGSSVLGTGVFSGFQGLLAGSIGEDLNGGMVGLDLRGTVGGDVEVEVESEASAPVFMHFMQSPVALPAVAPGLTLGDSAAISGRLSYTSRAEGAIAPTARVDGGLERREPEIGKDRERDLKARSLGLLRNLVALFLTGVLVLWWKPSWIDRPAEIIAARPLPSLGWGFLVLVLFPVAALVLLLATILLAALAGVLTLGKISGLVVVLGGLALLLLLAGSWLAAGFFAPIAAALCAGRWIFERLASDRTASGILALLTGLMLLTLLRLVPVLGGLVAFAAVLFGLGAIWLCWQERQAAD